MINKSFLFLIFSMGLQPLAFADTYLCSDQHEKKVEVDLPSEDVKVTFEQSNMTVTCERQAEESEELVQAIAYRRARRPTHPRNTAYTSGSLCWSYYCSSCSRHTPVYPLLWQYCR